MDTHAQCILEALSRLDSVTPIDGSVEGLIAADDAVRGAAAEIRAALSDRTVVEPGAWFYHDPLGDGFVKCDSAVEAQNKARETIEWSCEDEIPEEIWAVCWGRLCGEARMISERPDESGRYDSIQEWRLLPLPAPEAVAAVRTEGEDPDA